MGFKQTILISFLCLFLSITAIAQTVHQVAAGTDVLKPAVDAAAAGDIIELTTSGGVYLNADQIVINKDITIRAHETLEEKPIVKYIGTGTGAYMFKVETTANVIVDGIDFHGDGVLEGGAAKAKYIFRLDTGDSTSAIILKINDCDMHDTQDKVIRPYALTGIDSLIVHNTTIYNSEKEGLTLNSGTSSDPPVYMDYAEFINCTFYKTTREAIKGDTNPDTKLLVDHCTFYDIGGVDKPFIYIDDMLDVVIKNSVFQKNLEVGNFLRLEGDGNIVSNIVYWDVVDNDIDNTTSVSDTLHADPLYADPENADFTLLEGSPAIGYADDGYSAGDMRWDPTASMPQVHQVAAGTDVLKPAVDAANAGDIIELTSSGGVYLNADQIVIDKDITIRAREGLAQKPVVKYIGTGTGAYMFKVETTAKVIVDGIDFDGEGTGDGAAAKAKYIWRLDTGDSTSAIILKINDCEMHDTQDKVIRPYALTGVDSLIVHNTTIYNSDKEGLTLNSGSSSDPPVYMDYAEFINCTFYKTTREAIKGDTNPDTKLLVDQCTFYDIGGLDKPFIYIDDMLDVEIKNSIFQKNLEQGNFLRLEGDGNIVSNIVYWDVFDNDIDNTTSVFDTLHADPIFADPENADFTLAAESPARTHGIGGTPAGDLRWAIDPNSVLLSVVTVGSGIVTLDPAGGIYSPGTDVTLTAVPDLGWEFEMWSGINVFPPDANPTTITVNENTTATATFKNLTPQVTLETAVIGLGEISVDPEPGEDGTYDQGSVVTITGTPDSNWTFVEWKGDISSMDNPVQVTLDSNMTVVGSFMSTLQQVVLELNVDGMGTVSADPDTLPGIGSYDINTLVTISAEAAIGWEFVNWSGDLDSDLDTVDVLLDASKTITAHFIEKTVENGVLFVDDSWDLKDAVDFANNNSMVHTIELTTSGGLYTSTSTSDVAVFAPLTIRAAEGLEEKPVITNSDAEAGNDDIFRVFDDFTLQGVVMDGGHEMTHGMKYGIRLRHYTNDTVKTGTNIHLNDVDFKDFFQDKKETGDGHAFNIQVDVKAGDVLIENCTFTSFGYEAIRISDTEKWVTDGALESLTIRNCTFTNIDAEAVRYYSDLDAATPDAPVLIEHCTFNNTATRTIFLKNSGGAIVRDLIIANSRTSGHGRDDDLLDAQGNTDMPSYVSHIDTFNVKPVPIKSSDGEVDTTTIYGIDPEFEDHENMNYTLLATSHLYGLASDGEAMGDLNWAIHETVNKTLQVTAGDNGAVSVSPEPIGKTYSPGTVVTLTATPDSGYMFVDWSGDLTGSDNPVQVTMDDNKVITANFDVAVGVDELGIPEEFTLEQNYPNPFNPSTTVRFGLPEAATVTVVIYNALGQQVAQLVNNQQLPAGYHNVIWSARSDAGSGLASGLYIYRMNAIGVTGEKFIQTRKMMFLK